MGVLDDAIREHLELKRSHGAAEDEVQQQEKEALGPARREQPAEPEPAAEEPVTEAEVAPGEVDEVPAEAPPPPDAPLAELPPMPDFGREPEAAPDEPVPTGDTPADGFEPIEEPMPAPPPPAPPEDEGEDVLEETPEFLQETPEHDRLWFEQKPPRDFDFDE